MCLVLATGIAVLIHSWVSANIRLQSWLKGNASLRLTTLKIVHGDSRTSITNIDDLLELDRAAHAAKEAPGPFAFSKEAYARINRSWCGQIDISWLGDKIVIGIPSTAWPFEREFIYKELQVSNAVTEHLTEAVGPD